MTPPSITLPNGRRIGDGEPCFVVAEIGQNHNGDVYTALRLLKAAHEAGVDAVKFCKRHIPSDMTRAAYNAPYPGPNSFGATYGEHREALELAPEEYRHLKERMRYNEWLADAVDQPDDEDLPKQIMFASACDIQSVHDLWLSIDPPLYKIASRDLDNLPLIDYVARLGKPVILSTGLVQSCCDITDAILTVKKHHDKIVLLQCTSQYPTSNMAVGLNVIDRYRKQYGVLTGLSDHTPGIVAAQAAAAIGAVVVEKHITLSRAMKGTDHAGSLEPDGIKRLVRNIRVTETMMREHRHPYLSAERKKLGRSLVTTRGIQAGETINEDMICLKSPGTGIEWCDRHQVIGCAARTAIAADVTLQPSDVLLPEETAEDKIVHGIEGYADALERGEKPA